MAGGEKLLVDLGRNNQSVRAREGLSKIYLQPKGKKSQDLTAGGIAEISESSDLRLS